MSPRRKPSADTQSGEVYTRDGKCYWCGGRREAHAYDCMTQWRCQPGGGIARADSVAIGPPAPAWIVETRTGCVLYLRDDSRSYGALVGVARVWTQDEARARRYATREEAERVVAALRAEELQRAFAKAAGVSKVAP